MAPAERLDLALKFIEERDATQLLALLESDSSVSNATDESGRLLLHLALDYGSGAESTSSLEVVRCLLNCGASAETLDRDGQGCALHVACGALAREPSFALPALMLLLPSVSVPLDNLVDSEGSTPLGVAVHQGKQLSGEGTTRLASEDAIVSAVKLLLEGGCRLMQHSAPCTPAIEVATSQAREHGGDDGSDDLGALPSVRHGLRASLLHVASEWAPVRCVELLLQRFVV